MLYRASQHALFPDNAYGFDSGGDPRVIPNLTYEQFKTFHETYYHPSNARIFFYGDDDPTSGCVCSTRPAASSTPYRWMAQ